MAFGGIVPGSVRNVGSKLVFGGTVRLAVLYAAEDTGELCSAAFETEFSQMLDTERELTSRTRAVYTLLTAEYIDLTTLAGGEKGISAEYHLVSQAVICDSARLNVLSDCYCNSRELVCETQEPAISSVRGAAGCCGPRRGRPCRLRRPVRRC